jgi:hypothetical protein
MTTSIWIVKGDSPYKEDWGPFFATEREARDYVYAAWGKECKFWGVLPSEATFEPSSVAEYRLPTVKEALSKVL